MLFPNISGSANTWILDTARNDGKFNRYYTYSDTTKGYIAITRQNYETNKFQLIMIGYDHDCTNYYYRKIYNSETDKVGGDVYDKTTLTYTKITYKNKTFRYYTTPSISVGANFIWNERIFEEYDTDFGGVATCVRDALEMYFE